MSIVVVCEDGELIAKEEVCLKNEYFKTMLNSGMKESFAGRVQLNVRKEALELILTYVMLNRPQNFDSLPIGLSKLSHVAHAATYLLEKELAANIENKISVVLQKKELSWDTWASTLQYAVEHELSDLSRKCFQFWIAANGFLRSCSNCPKDEVFAAKFLSMQLSLGNPGCGACPNSYHYSFCIFCSSHVREYCLASGNSRCNHKDWPSVFSDAIKMNTPSFSDKAKTAFEELLCNGGEDAVMFMLQEGSSNPKIFPYLRTNIFDQISSSPAPAPGLALIVKIKKLELEFFMLVRQLCDKNLPAFLKGCRALSDTTLAPWMLLAATRGRVLSAELTSLADGVSGADLNVCDEMGSVLHDAVRMQSPLLCKYLLSKGANVNLLCKETPLHEGVAKEDLNLIQLLLSHHADPNIRNKAGRTALHSALAKPEIKVCRLLLEHKADPNLLYCGDGETSEWTPLQYAISASRLDLARLLLQHGADPNFKTKLGKTALHWAVKESDEATSLFLKHGADANVPTSGSNELPLHFALELRHLERAKMLFNHKADVNMKGSKGQAALHVAVASGSIESASWLLHVGANVNAARDDGMTALHLAVSMRLLSMAQVLLSRENINCELKTKTGDSALLLACVAPAHEELFDLLLDRTECFADANDAGNTCSTLLRRQADACTKIPELKALIGMSERLLAKMAPCNVQ